MIYVCMCGYDARVCTIRKCRLMTTAVTRSQRAGTVLSAGNGLEHTRP